MNKIIALFAAIIISFSVNAQATTFSVSPNDTSFAETSLDELQSLTINLIHTTNDTLFLSWKKVYENIPSNWEATVCDYQHCYTSLLDSGTMDPVVAGDDGLMNCHITPHINFGITIIRYAVWDNNFPTLIDTLTWIVTCNTLGINPINSNQFQLSVYPNPAKDYFYISNYQLKPSDKIELLNRMGETLAVSANQNTITVTSLNEGIYFFKIISGSQVFVSKIVKQ